MACAGIAAGALYLAIQHVSSNGDSPSTVTTLHRGETRTIGDAKPGAALTCVDGSIAVTARIPQTGTALQSSHELSIRLKTLASGAVTASCF